MVNALVPLLSGGDRRSIGKVAQVVRLVQSQPRHMADLVAGLWHDDEVVRMRAADALEKVSAGRPQMILPFRRTLLSLAERATQQEVRWHLAQILPRLPLIESEQARLTPILFAWLDDPSHIVQVNTLQALADLSASDAGLRFKLLPVAEAMAVHGAPSVRARLRSLLQQLRAATL